jgi:HNH endonuclease
MTRQNGLFDHIVLIKRGGSNNPHNLQLLCRKKAKDPLKDSLSVGILNGRIAYARIMGIMEGAE